MSAVGYGMTLMGKAVHLTLTPSWTSGSLHGVKSLCGRWLIAWIDGSAEAVAPHCRTCVDSLVVIGLLESTSTAIDDAQNRRVDKDRPKA